MACVLRHHTRSVFRCALVIFLFVLAVSGAMGSQASSSCSSTEAAQLDLRFIHRSVSDRESRLPRFADLPQHQKRVEAFSVKLLFFSEARRAEECPAHQPSLARKGPS